MNNVLARHTCDKIPKGFIVLKSSANGWVVADNSEGYAETKVWGINNCPFCGDKLEENQ
jgi:hypothetical protein